MSVHENNTNWFQQPDFILFILWSCKSVERLISSSDSFDVQIICGAEWRYDTSPCNNGGQTEMNLEQIACVESRMETKKEVLLKSFK